MVEFIDVINEDGSSKGYSLPRDEIHKQGLWHRVVHVWIVDNTGNLLIQQRSDDKESFPSYWDISAAGHCEAGMSSLESAIKEIGEELGVHITDPSSLEFLFSVKKQYVLKNGSYIDNELADVYLLSLDRPIDLNSFVLQKEEVQAVKLIHHKQLSDLVSKRDPTFVPLMKENNTFENCEYHQFFELLENRYNTK